MIGYLRGIVTEIRPKEIIVLTSGGVGYSVHPAGSLLANVQKGKEISAEIFTVVKETELSLYGFGSFEEKELFVKLINVSGIGPKTALGMISVPIGQFLNAVENGDIAFLTRIPGLGKKTAERLIIELRGKLDLTNVTENAPQSPAFEEAEDALKNLGYDRHTILKALKTAPEGKTAEDLVKYFLSSNA